jgi:hypothetical protein
LTSPPEVEVVRLATWLVLRLGQFALADARDFDEATVSRAALLESAMVLIAVAHGPLLCFAVVVLLLALCAAILGAKKAPSPTTIVVIRW